MMYPVPWKNLLYSALALKNNVKFGIALKYYINLTRLNLKFIGIQKQKQHLKNLYNKD